ncbi:MAG: TetR/AcrR family transcriptional regulator [Acidobacteriota bacterium]
MTEQTPEPAPAVTLGASAANGKHHQKAEEIYRAAAQIFFEKGYHATSINEIADAVHLTKAGLYYYIRGKQDLLFGIMTYAMDLIEERVIRPANDISDPLDRVAGIVSAHASFIVHESSALNILVNELQGLNAENRTQITARQKTYLDFIREALREVESSTGRKVVDPTVGAFGLLGMILWISRWYQPGGRLSDDQVVREITSMATAAIFRPSDTTP